MSFLIVSSHRVIKRHMGVSQILFQHSFCSTQFPNPRSIKIPMDKLDFGFSRSSGPGGQNVNKVNTKAEIRFNVDEADWIASEVKDRLKNNNSNRISKEGDLIITCQEHRTQGHNKEECIKKLQDMIADAMVAPKDREIWEGISEEGKRNRVRTKQQRSEVKQSRRPSKGDFDW